MMLSKLNFKIFAKATCLGRIRFYTNRNVFRLNERGLIHDLFPDEQGNQITNLLNSGPQTVYAGFDPTADSLHVGNLLVIVCLLHWQRAGHRVIALIGGATGRVGDPSGRSTDRPVLNNKIATENGNAIGLVIEQIFKNHEKYIWRERGHKEALIPPKIVNNAGWYEKMSSIDFVGNISRNFRMGTLLSRSSVKERLSSSNGMSAAEFLYQIFQAYDWYHLLNSLDCRFQIGGADQMGNIMSGHDLISRLSSKTVYGLTVPLITTDDGKKLGKSVGNSIWLDGEKSSPFAFYQYFLRQKDVDSIRLLKLFTFLEEAEIAKLELEQKRHPADRPALKVLAENVTLLVHGVTGLETAKRVSVALYSKDKEKLARLLPDELAQVFEGAKIVDLYPEAGMTVLELAVRAKCFATLADAKRIISAGGFFINNDRIQNINEAIVAGVHILPAMTTLIRVGKKNYHIIRWLS